MKLCRTLVKDKQKMYVFEQDGEWFKESNRRRKMSEAMTLTNTEYENTVSRRHAPPPAKETPVLSVGLLTTPPPYSVCKGGQYLSLASVSAP